MLSIGTKVKSLIDHSLDGFITGYAIQPTIAIEGNFYVVELINGFWSENKMAYISCLVAHEDSFAVVEETKFAYRLYPSLGISGYVMAEDLENATRKAIWKTGRTRDDIEVWETESLY